MSYEDGWAAINLEMPARIPRTEYSADSHWDLIKAVTGIEVGIAQPGRGQDAGRSRGASCARGTTTSSGPR